MAAHLGGLAERVLAKLVKHSYGEETEYDELGID